VDVILVLGSLFILVGLAFKLSVVPFHFWCPDVFEGAAAEVAAFLSVASKAAAFALTGRLILELAKRGALAEDLPLYFGPPLAALAAITATFGNLAAYAQTNLKRLLAYSTIAHAGYMLMGLAAVTVDGVQAVLIYLVAYVFMNLGAFAVVAFIRNRTGSEELSAYRGLVYRAPVVVVLLSIFLLSLLGIPPLAGFIAKFQVFAELFRVGRVHSGGPHPWLGTVYYGLLVIGGLNTVFSAFYYMRVVKAMVFEKSVEEVEGQVSAPVGVPADATVFAGLLALAVVVLVFVWNPLFDASDRGARTFAYEKPPAAWVGELPMPAGVAGGGGGAPKAGDKGKAKGGDKGKAGDKGKGKGDDKGKAGGGGQPNAGAPKGEPK
jgi:NADH-quinone oxidoreductase subunit N